MNTTLKIGDRVRTKGNCLRFFPAGAVGFVKLIGNDGTALVEFDLGQEGVDPDCNSCWWADVNQLEVIAFDAAPAEDIDAEDAREADRRENLVVAVVILVGLVMLAVAYWRGEPTFAVEAVNMVGSVRG